MSFLREKEIERLFCRRVAEAGGLAIKLASPGFAGLPDRLVLMKGARAVFVELKRPGEKPRALQIARHKSLKSLGFEVYVIDSLEKAEEVLNAVQTV